MGFLFTLMVGFVVVAGISYWASTLLLASLFKIFNFKEEYIQYYTRVSGAPPSRKRQIITAFGACSHFFMMDWAHDSATPNGLKLVPNGNMVRMLFLGFASFLSAGILWVLAAFVYLLVGAYL